MKTVVSITNGDFKYLHAAANVMSAVSVRELPNDKVEINHDYPHELYHFGIIAQLQKNLV